MVHGKDWHKEISTPQKSVEKYAERNQFYEKRVKLKTKVALATLLGDLAGSGFQTLEDHKGKTLNLEIKSGNTLFKILRDYYRSKFELNKLTAEKEAYISLAYLMKTADSPSSAANVDMLSVGGNLSISRDGELRIKDAAGKSTLQGYLRPPSSEAPEPPERDTEDTGLDTEDTGLDTDDTGLDTDDSGLDTDDSGVDTDDAGLDTDDADSTDLDPRDIDGTGADPDLDDDASIDLDTMGSDLDDPDDDVVDEGGRIDVDDVDEARMDSDLSERDMDETSPSEPDTSPTEPEISPSEPDTSPSEPETEPGYSEVFEGVSSNVGDLEFVVKHAERVTIDDRYGDTLYHFIKGMIADQNVLPAGIAFNTRLEYINGVIILARELNEGITLDDFAGIEGKEIVLPLEFTVIPAFQKPIKSYERLQNAALIDGDDLSSVANRKALFENARDNFPEVPASGNGYYRAEGYTNSPAHMEAEAFAKFEALASQFAEETEGWQLSYSHILRDEDLQKAQRGNLLESTHFTGRTIDITDGRFRTPDGNEITWTGDPGYQEQIGDDNSGFREVIIRLAHANGAMIYPEGTAGHYHIYFPKVNEFKMEAPEERVIITAPESEDVDVTDIEFPESLPDGESMFPAYEKMSSEDAQRQYTNFMETYEEFFADVANPITRILDYSSIDLSAEEEALLTMQMDELNESIVSLATERDANPDRKDELQGQINQLVRVRKVKIYEEYMDLILRMEPADVESLEILKGTTVHTNSYSFADLEGAWEYKNKRRGGRSVTAYYELMKDELADLDSSYGISDWEADIAEVNPYIQEHGETLGLDFEMAEYVDEKVMLGVIHAEFFSEMDAGLYVQMVPLIFESYNLRYGPAMGDRLFSGGLVQMTETTFKEKVRSYGGKIKKVQDADSSIDVMIPNTSKKAEVIEAMFTDTKSAMFYDLLVTYDHIELANNRLMQDADFKAAWNNADEGERQEFVASLSAMAINSGRGGAGATATKLLRKINGSNLVEYTDALPQVSQDYWTNKGKSRKGKTTKRGAERGRATFLELAERA